MEDQIYNIIVIGIYICIAGYVIGTAYTLFHAIRGVSGAQLALMVELAVGALVFLIYAWLNGDGVDGEMGALPLTGVAPSLRSGQSLGIEERTT